MCLVALGESLDFRFGQWAVIDPKLVDVTSEPIDQAADRAPIRSDRSRFVDRARCGEVRGRLGDLVGQDTVDVQSLANSGAVHDSDMHPVASEQANRLAANLVRGGTERVAADFTMTCNVL